MLQLWTKAVELPFSLSVCHNSLITSSEARIAFYTEGLILERKRLKRVQSDRSRLHDFRLLLCLRRIFS